MELLSNHCNSVTLTKPDTTEIKFEILNTADLFKTVYTKIL
jgi:hypothetical protein